MAIFFNFEFIISEIFLSLSILFILFYSSFFFKKDIQNFVIYSFIFIFINFIFINCEVYNIVKYFKVINLFGGILVNSVFLCFSKFIIVFFSISCLLVSTFFLKSKNIKRFEYSILVAISVLGMLFLVSSNDFISLYLAMELQGLSTYILAGYSSRSAFSTEAGLKYFVVGSFSSGIFLLGSALVYIGTGSVSFNDFFIIYNNCCPSTVVILGMSLILCSLGFKLGSAPLHMWLPDVYEGSISPVSTFFAVVSKIGVFCFIIRIIYGFSDSCFFFIQPIIFFMGLSSLFFGVFSALYQRNIKRFLAYSSISHVGYILLCINSGSFFAIKSFFVYILLYLPSALAIWILVINLNQFIYFKNSKYITDLSGVSKINVVLAVSVVLILLSMSGIPPLAGFFAKFSIIFSMVNNGFYFVGIMSIFFSMVGAFYYLRWAKIVYSDSYLFNKNMEVVIYSFNSVSSYIFISCLYIIVFYFIDPFLLNVYSTYVAKYIF